MDFELTEARDEIVRAHPRPVSQEMVLNSLSEHVLGLPRSY